MLGATLIVKFSMSDLCRESSCVSKLVLDFNTRFIDGWFRSSLQRETARLAFLFFSSQTRRKEGYENNNGKAAALSCRLDLKYPPTAVGGI